MNKDEGIVVYNKDNNILYGYSRHKNRPFVHIPIEIIYKRDLYRVKVHNDITMKCTLEKM